MADPGGGDEAGGAEGEVGYAGEDAEGAPGGGGGGDGEWHCGRDRGCVVVPSLTASHLFFWGGVFK